MKLRGVEEIRFAPGMFQAQADSFFSYAFVFSVTKEQELTPAVIQQEILVYYRGARQIGFEEQRQDSRGSQVHLRAGALEAGNRDTGASSRRDGGHPIHERTDLG